MRIVGAFLAAVAAILIFTGCQSGGGVHVSAGTTPPPPPRQVVVVKEKHGPPPHAPAHGYRHKHADGYDLRYDRTVGCYAVVGYSDHYYNDGFFFRYSADNWQISAHIGGAQASWSVVEEVRVPQTLVVKYKGKDHGKGNKGGKGKGKGNKHSELAPAATPIMEARWGKY